MPRPNGALSRMRALAADSGIRRCLTSIALLAAIFATSCTMLPAEFNLSPIYRHRIAPDGRLSELDVLWPLFHWERARDGSEDVRIRPLWRRVKSEDGSKSRHEFLVPLGEGRFDETEELLRLFPLFYWRKHLHNGIAGQWDVDWWLTPLVWGGHSTLGENYFGVLPFYGSIPQFLGYERLTWILFPLFLRTENSYKKTVDGKTTSSLATGTHLLWPFVGWGSSEDPARGYWWRALPFFAKSVVPGKRESYSALWPFFHWGKDRLDKPSPTSSFFFFPFFGTKTGGAFFSWTFLWPLFRHAGLSEEGEAAKNGEYTFWDLPFPLLRWLDNTWSSKPLHQRWVFPFYQRTWTDRQDSTIWMWPFVWLRRYWNKVRDQQDTWILPFFWRNRIRHKKAEHAGTRVAFDDDDKYEAGEDDHWRFWPLADHRTDRYGNWRFRALSPWPFDGYFARGVREAYDFAWTLWHEEGDAAGNRRQRAFAHLWSSRNYAGQRYQSSVPFLFNYEAEDGEDGARTLRLFQFIPIRWGGRK